MAEEINNDSGAQREFDPQREKAGVNKLRDWDAEIRPDPVMEELGGESWWKGLLKNKPKGPENLKKDK